MSLQAFGFLFLFLPIVVSGYFLLCKIRSLVWGKLWLIAASLFFYAGGRLSDLPILVGAVAVNQLIARRLLSGSPGRSQLLTGGIIGNVVFLCYFKYTGFFVGTFDQITSSSWKIPHILFPLGISFFTIQQIMFLVDCYENLIEDYTPLDHILFACFFPYITMGPLVRWKQVVPQWNDPKLRRVNPGNISEGLFILVIGLFKKAVLADTFFQWADAGFAYHSSLSFGGAWLAALSFTLELYFDFSGYTDIAIGAARMLNIAVPQNFNAPFRAQSIVDFWRRWHMTLTGFITGYLYTPMVRSMKKVTFAKAMMATFIAMVITGFWHGAAWTFIVFGAIHGIGLVINQSWKKQRWPMPAALGWAFTFTLVVVSLVFFRSASIGQGGQILASMFSFRGGLFDYAPWSGIDRIDQLTGIGWMLFGTAIVVRAPSSLQLQRAFKPSWANAAIAILLALIACAYSNGVVSRSFVYRDF